MSPDPDRAKASWRKAEAHLNEAKALDPNDAPMAIIHSSYYAMFHGARAALFQATGNAPKTHDGVIQQFGLLARNSDEKLRSAGRALNEMKDERNHADYDETVTTSSGDAGDALHAAVNFLSVCAASFGFATPSGS